MELFKAFGRLALEGADEVSEGLREADEEGREFADGLGEVQAEAEDTSAALEDTAESSNSLTDALAEVGDGVSRVGDRMSMWVSGPLAAVGAGLLAITSSVAGFGDELAKTARTAGMTVAEYQEIEFALSRIAGVSEAQTQVALRDLNRVLAEASDGMQSSIDDIQRLGFSLEEIESGSVTAERAVMATADAIKQAGSDAEANAIAIDVFGTRAGTQLAANIRQGAESVEEAREIFREEIGGMTQDQAEMAEAFGDQWDVISRQFMQVVREIGMELAPTFMDLMDLIQERVVPGVQKAGEAVNGVIQAFQALPAPVQGAIGAAVGFVAVLGPLLSIMGRLIGPVGRLVGMVVSLAAGKGALAAAVIPLLPILAKVAVVVAAVYAAFKLLEGAVRLVSALAENFGGIWERVSGLVMGLVDSMGQRFRDFASGMVATIRQGIESVVGFFQQLPGRVMQFINQMVQAVLNRIRSMVSGVLSALGSMFRAVVGNSIIPDMASMVVDEMTGMADDSIREAGRMGEGVEESMPDAGLERDGRAAGGGRGGSYVDMRHAIIRDDRDMVARSARRGADLTGAF